MPCLQSYCPVCAFYFTSPSRFYIIKVYHFPLSVNLIDLTKPSILERMLWGTAKSPRIFNESCCPRSFAQEAQSFARRNSFTSIAV